MSPDVVTPVQDLEMRCVKVSGFSEAVEEPAAFVTAKLLYFVKRHFVDALVKG